MLKQKEGGCVTLERDTCALIVGVNEQLQQSKEKSLRAASWRQHSLPEPQQTIVFSSVYFLQKKQQTYRYIRDVSRKRWGAFTGALRSLGGGTRSERRLIITDRLCFSWLFNCRAVWSSRLLLCWWRRCPLNVWQALARFLMVFTRRVSGKRRKGT